MEKFDDYLASTSCAPKVRANVYRIKPDLLKLYEMDAEKIQRIRRRLNDLARKLGPHKKQYVFAVLCIVKKIGADVSNSSGAFQPYDAHVVSDHAFCRALERFYGVDVRAMKDQIKRELVDDERAVPVKSDGKIITFLPATPPA
ncbi:MAG: hypothetical protein J0H19_24055 [Rhodospirillales bacterium]|nr:hypothetical protein [Rhodospirillales bacterium]MBN8929682.1 hypothetical protein [Rhodospirillales bacterium]